jgi:CRP-like cAMP-binding protein
MMKQQDLNVLQQIFPNLSSASLDELYEKAKHAEYPPDVTLCHENEEEDTFYVLLEGTAHIYRHLDGEMIYIDKLERQCFGEIALLLDRPRTADIVTASPVRALEIRREDFLHYFKLNPEIVVEITKYILRRVLGQQEQLLAQLAVHRKQKVSDARIFISYSSVDRDFVERLARDLKREKFDVWLDIHYLEPGKSWSRQVGKALDTCEAMLLIISPDSLASENVDDEWNYYLDTKKIVLPVLYRECTIPFRLHKLHYIDFVRNDYYEAFNRLVGYLSRLTTSPPDGPELPQSPHLPVR